MMPACKAIDAGEMTLSTQFAAGEAVPVGSGTVPVFRVLCGNASIMTGPGTNSYLIGSDAMALVDPGPADPAHTQALLRILAGRPLRWIFVTHTHGDHSPGTVALHSATGAQVIGLAPPEGGYQDHSFVPNRLYMAGERIDCGEFSMQLIHTPGHVSNHLCFLLEQEGMLFTGDHILQGTTPVILPPDGNMSDYLESLRALKALPLRSLAPGHGDIMLEPQQSIETLIRHRLRREQKVLTGLAELGACSIDALLIRVYDDVPQHLMVWAKKTLLAHLLKLQTEQKISLLDEQWVLL
jgi:glyoxylase-like metal-dependent hydrolase (beta-lactamase superfamily II)